jgi:hypothetical protein
MARFRAIGRVLGWSEETLTGVGRARANFGGLATGRQTSLFGAELFGVELLGRALRSGRPASARCVARHEPGLECGANHARARPTSVGREANSIAHVVGNHACRMVNRCRVELTSVARSALAGNGREARARMVANRRYVTSDSSDAAPSPEASSDAEESSSSTNVLRTAASTSWGHDESLDQSVRRHRGRRLRAWVEGRRSDGEVCAAAHGEEIWMCRGTDTRTTTDRASRGPQHLVWACARA